MDVTFNNVLEGTRQYFMGLPKAQIEGSGQSVWATGAPPPEESALAQSGAPAVMSRPPSAAAAPPSTTGQAATPAPPRPPSEPLEPEPHIIHKATVMREAAEKRREQPSPDEEEEPVGALSPPSHIIRKPPPRALPSPAPAPAAPAPSPARPPSATSLIQSQAPEPQPQPESSAPYRQPVHRVQTPSVRPPDLYAPSRPPDPYSTSRPPEPYTRYHYDSTLPDGGRNSLGPPVASPQPSAARHSPHPQQTYARLSSTMPQHAASRLRDSAAQSPPAQRYAMPPTPTQPQHNDRVPPIHHPQTVPPQRLTPIDSRSQQVYAPLVQRRESSPYTRASTHYDRHSAVTPRKYDPQQAYPGYRPSPPIQPLAQNHRMETHPQVQYKYPSSDVINAHYARPPERPIAPPPQTLQHDSARLPTRAEYPNMNRSVDSRTYHYATPSTSTTRYPSNVSVPVVQNTPSQSRTLYRPPTVQKSSYEYSATSQTQTSPARSSAKSGYQNQQARMTVSVTTLVNQMNQTKQKRESPLDLSVKTVKNSADSSTTQDELIDSASMDNKSLQLQQRPSSSNRLISQSTSGYVASHKVDFAPDFSQYRERNVGHNYNNNIAQPGHPPIRYNGAYETPRPIAESYPAESRHQVYPEQNKVLDRNNVPPVARTEYVPRIDLTRSVGDERLSESRVRDDRHLIIEERKRPAGSIVSNIPEKIVRYETWSSDSRIDRLSRSSREQHELMSRPVYSYSNHKRFEAYHSEHKRPTVPNANVYRESSNLSPHVNHRYSYPTEPLTRESSDYQAYYHDRNLTSNSRHVIQKIPSHKDLYSHSHHLDSHSGVPADKRVLNILRNTLETKQTGYVESARSSRHIPDLIVIDDVDDIDDSVIEITDLTKENDTEVTTRNNSSKPIQNQISPNLGHHIQMPKAIDSIARDSDYQKFDNLDPKSKSPENDVASRIRTKAELKVMPPSQDSSIRSEPKQDPPVENDKIKLLPKSQKQHLFNQIREDNLRLESVIKTETHIDILIPEVKTEPMNIEEIEKDAQMPIKTENILEDLQPESSANMINAYEEDLDWASACDSFMEQLKFGCVKKKPRRKRFDTFNSENESSIEKNPKTETTEPSSDKTTTNLTPAVIIKQEPLDEEDMQSHSENVAISLKDVTLEKISEKIENYVNVKDESGNKEQNESINEIAECDKEKNKLDIKDKCEKKNFDVNSESQKKSDRNSLKEKSENKKEKDKCDPNHKEKHENKNEKYKVDIKKNSKDSEKPIKSKVQGKQKLKTEKHNSPSTSSAVQKKEKRETETIKTIVKEESESTDDDEPLIKSKLLKEKEQSDRVKFQLMKDLTEKSAYVKLECCDVEIRKSVDSTPKEKEEKSKSKITRQMSRSKGKSLPTDINKQDKQKQKSDSSSDSEDDDLSVASRLRLRKNIKVEENKIALGNKTPGKTSPSKKLDSIVSTNSTPVRKPFGDGSDFHPGWEEELYRYKRSLRMPARLIAIPRGRSGGPFRKGSGPLFTRGSTSLPDLDPAPLSPAPSSAPSAATDDLFARRPEKLTLDSDLDSNSSCSAANRLHYDSEASTSTVFSSSNIKKRGSSIVDVLIQKCGRGENAKKKSKEKEKTPKIIPKSSTDLLPTPSLGLLKNNNRGTLSAKKEKLMEDIFYLGAFRKETVTAYRDAFIKNTGGLIGATEEFAPVVLKSRTRTESRVLKQRATIKEVFGDERPASAPPTSCREEDQTEPILVIKKEPESRSKLKSKKLGKDKLKRRSSSIRDGLRSTQSLKRNDANGRLLRLKKRNNLINSLANKRIKEIASKQHKKNPTLDGTNKTNDEGNGTETTEGTTKRRLKRLFGRRKFSSGFDYIRKKKKIMRRDDATNKVRRPTVKPSPESVHDIQKEIKSWFINKSVGETHLHRAARLGYTDCVAYCLEKMGVEPSAKDNAGFTPLHVAAAKGHVRIARLLLQYGANVSAAAQGGIRPLHEACENCHVEIIRLLLSYGADPLLGTYAGQTPEELAEGAAATLLRLHIADVQGHAIEPWRFPPPADIIDREELGCDPLASPPPASPPPPPDSTIEIQCTEAPLPPFYSLKPAPGQPADGLWCLLQDITNLLQIKSKESLLKQIHCGSGSPKELLREIRTQEFLERAQCHQLFCAGEKVNVRASKVALVRVTDKLRQLLKIETILVS